MLEYKIQFDHPPVVWFCLQLVLTEGIKHVGSQYQTARHSNIVANTDKVCLWHFDRIHWQLRRVEDN